MYNLWVNIMEDGIGGVAHFFSVPCMELHSFTPFIMLSFASHCQYICACSMLMLSILLIFLLASHVLISGLLVFPRAHSVQIFLNISIC